MTQTTLIDWLYPSKLLWSSAAPPVLGSFPVYWLVGGEWVHKGWLMPQVR